VRRLLGRAVSAGANGAWSAAQWLNARVPDKPFRPPWAPAPMLKKSDRTFPPLGFPRETDSLCPGCVLEVRSAIVSGEVDWSVLVQENPGEIRARIVERGSKIYMEKDCAKHGAYSDLISIDAEFLRRIERLYPGRDFRIAPDGLHEHGSSSIRWGRGAVLTVDLTNRCNMMCDPCFMDANQVGYVHELGLDDVRQILDDAIRVKPRRQLSVQFSGGEPTISPIFLDSIAYARKLGYFSIQCATNGIRFAQEPDFARQAKAAGLRLAYLQFDGVGQASHEHRKVGNLYDVKLRALENLHAAGIDVTLVVTVVNSINDDQVGSIIRFAIEHIDKVNAVSFQPVSFTGRDEDLDAETRTRWRYTLSHLAHAVKQQTGLTEPLRDWYPLSASGPLSDFVDHVRGGRSEWGSLKCGCHPNCGVGTLLLVNERTREAVPLTEILNTDARIEDFQQINERHRPRGLMVAQAMLSIVRNYNLAGAPRGLGFANMLRVADGHTGGHMRLTKKSRHEWRVLLVAGMWFQDLFNYDFRRTEMCIIPYATQMGEISFCAYNTGVGWRKIVEQMHQSASTAEWFKTKGRHPIYAGGKSVPLPASDGALLQIGPQRS
jgi:uncharacterized radical SAM superfamily Fe-S cluster-containing enzyme